jgi:ferredoxin
MIMVDVVLDIGKCRGSKCGVCAYVCPTNVFAIKDDQVIINSPQYCKLCYECLETCPTAALNIKKTEGDCL